MLQNRITGAIGPKGSGKTFTIAEYLKTQSRFVVFDIMGDAAYLVPADDVIFDRMALLEAVKEPEFRIVYRAKIERDEKSGEIVVPDLNFVVDVAFATGNMLLIIDEAHILCDARNIPPSLFLATTTGRHAQLSILYVSHRFSTVHRILTTNTDEFWFWRIIEPADIDGIAKRCGPDVAERVFTARKLERNINTGEVVPGEMTRWTVENGLESNTGDDNAEGKRTTETDD